MTARTSVSSGSPWEPLIGYATAVRVENWVAVSGCTASSLSGSPTGGDDVEEQTTEALRKVGDALTSAGAAYRHVVRTRIHLTPGADVDAVGRAHGQVFGAIRPATTIVFVSGLTGQGLLVEIDADAYIDDDQAGT